MSVIGGKFHYTYSMVKMHLIHFTEIAGHLHALNMEQQSKPLQHAMYEQRSVLCHDVLKVCYVLSLLKPD